MRFTYQSGEQPLAGYTIQRGIHRGGFGEVYFGHSGGGKEVALKLLHDQDHETELRGVNQCLNLKHPNLVNIFDVKTDAHGDHWVVMEYVAGSSLEDVLASFPDGLPIAEVRDWLSGLVAGVSHLHDKGIVHRDLKPANVYRENGVVKVGDVGLSKRLDSENRRQHTQSVGTVYYMAPEVAQGKYGPEVDVYSLGVMLYEMVTGKLPFTGETTAEILMKHLTAQPDLTPIPKSLRSTVARALEKDPRKRTPTVRQLEQDFLRAIGTVTEPQTIPESAFLPPPIPPQSNGNTKDATPWISVRVNRPFPGPFVSTDKTPAKSNNTSIFWESGFPKPWIFIVGLVIVSILTSGRGRFMRLGLFPIVVVIPAFFVISMIFREFKGRRRLCRASKPRRESFEAMPETIRTAAYRRAAGFDNPASTIRPRSETLPNAMPRAFRPVGTQRAPSDQSIVTPMAPLSIRIAELGRSIGSAGLIASILSLGILFSLITLHRSAVMPSTEHAVLFAAVSIIGSWLLLIGQAVTVHPVWTKQQRFGIRLAVGALLGTCAFVISQFLMVHTPSAAYAIKPIVTSLVERPLTIAGVEPTWLGYVVFFAGWLGTRRWSRDMDPRRKKQFSIPLTAAAVAMAYVVSLLFAFPQWYAMFWAGTISATVQLASVWTPKPLSAGGR